MPQNPDPVSSATSRGAVAPSRLFSRAKSNLSRRAANKEHSNTSIVAAKSKAANGVSGKHSRPSRGSQPPKSGPCARGPTQLWASSPTHSGEYLVDLNSSLPRHSCTRNRRERWPGSRQVCASHCHATTAARLTLATPTAESARQDVDPQPGGQGQGQEREEGPEGCAGLLHPDSVARWPRLTLAVPYISPVAPSIIFCIL